MSGNERIYLDHNASSPLRPAARAAMIAALDLPGNASSTHQEGRAARAVLEEARKSVGALCGVPARHVVFTSGATEAAGMALTPALCGAGAEAAHLLLFAGEHACALQGHRFPAERVRSVASTGDGALDIDDLARAISGLSGAPFVLALQAANNETGAIQPVNAAAPLVRAAGGVLVCDAVQAAGRLRLDALDADYLLLSAHKIGGPKGGGALVGLRDAPPPGLALVRGGGQERGLRGGTENVAGAAGFGAAARAALEALATEPARLEGLRNRLEEAVLAVCPDATILARGAERLSNTSCFAVPGLSAETMLIALDLEGLALSSGSACSSGKVAASHVLKAMGVADGLARSALRASLGWTTSEADIVDFARRFDAVARKMVARRAQSAA